MVEFKRDKKTGIVYAYRDGKLIGPVVPMGDLVFKGDKKDGHKNH